MVMTQQKKSHPQGVVNETGSVSRDGSGGLPRSRKSERADVSVIGIIHLKPDSGLANLFLCAHKC